MSGGPQDLSELEKDPRLYLYTSLTAGSSHIVTATSRIETILRANRIPFQHIDTATNEKAKRLWQRRAGKRKLPALVKEGFVIGDLEQIEEWNEFGEIKEAIGPCPPAGAPVAPPPLPLPVKPTATAGTSKISPPAKIAAPASQLPKHQQPIALPGAAEIAARNNPLPKSSPDDAVKPETITSAPAEKEKSINAAAAVKSESNYGHPSAPARTVASGTATSAEKKENVNEASSTDKDKHEEHLSVPASAFQSRTATPAELAVEKKELEPVSSASGNVKDAPTQEVKKAEKPAEIKEELFREPMQRSDSDSLVNIAEHIQDMQLGDGKIVGQQEAGKAEDAVKSVED